MSVSMQTVCLWLLQSAAGGGLIMLLTFGLMMRVRQPALKQRLGEWGLAAALTVAVLCLFPAWLPVEVSGMLAHGESEKPVGEKPANWVFSMPPMIAENEFPARPMPEFLEKPNGAPVTTPHADKQETRDSANTPLVWFDGAHLQIVLAGIVAIYVLGLALLLIRLALAFVWLRRMIRHAAPAPPSIHRILRGLVPKGSRPRLLVAAHLRIPISFGLLRPTIVLPVGICATAEKARLRWILTHELTHLQRRDTWSGILCGLAQAVFFFVPWCWSICRQIRLCQEFVADASAAGRDQEADYAEFLLSLTKTPALPMVAAGVSGNSSDLFRRVTMLVEKPIQIERKCSRRWLALSAGALLGVAVLVSGVGLADGDDQKRIIVITNGKKDVKVEEKKIEDGVITLKLRIGGDDHKIQKQPQIKIFKKVLDKNKADGGKKIIIIRKAGPGNEDVREIVIGNDGNIADAKQSAKKKKVRVIVIGDKNKKNGGQKKEIKKKVRVIVVGDKDKGIHLHKDGIHQNIEIELKLDKNTLNLPDLKKALQELEKVLGKKETERIREHIHKALKNIPNRQSFKVIPHLKFKGFDTKKLDELKKKFSQFDYQKLIKDKTSGRNFTVPYFYQHSGKGRLGVSVEKPSAILSDQLNLAKGKGLVVTDVLKGTAAEKAGLKRNDVLVEFNGKAVSNNTDAFIKMVGAVKSKDPVNAVVLRKGKRRTIKGIKLAERKSAARYFFQDFDKDGRLNLFVPRGGGQFQYVFPGKGSVTMSITRNNDRFTANFLQGGLAITITGQVEEGKAHLSQVNIREGGKTQSYTGINDVPEKHRAKVRRILDSVNSGAFRVESNKD